MTPLTTHYNKNKTFVSNSSIFQESSRACLQPCVMMLSLAVWRWPMCFVICASHQKLGSLWIRSPGDFIKSIHLQTNNLGSLFHVTPQCLEFHNPACTSILSLLAAKQRWQGGSKLLSSLAEPHWSIILDMPLFWTSWHSAILIDGAPMFTNSYCMH